MPPRRKIIDVAPRDRSEPRPPAPAPPLGPLAEAERRAVRAEAAASGYDGNNPGRQKRLFEAARDARRAYDQLRAESEHGG